ncbi:Hsp20/alpha crystallin family protein [Saccharospirillum impatiens]|jgi:HSP20 family protein|uniref:Hsp20/alpha crystallin family protein n=1 Tax=Saccharospirillum impatiens TaxID=169438 RepID=UPI00041895F5|nr:Hsp20/alpha crystallin family protein [Saccharospirillum impatiens]
MENTHQSQSKLAPKNWFKHQDSRELSAIDRRKPLFSLIRMRDDMDRLFDQAFGSTQLPSLFDDSDWFADSTDMLRPNVDIAERKDTYVITAEVPGVEEADLKLTLEQDCLVISGEKHSEHEDTKDKRVHRVERSYGQFRRVLALPSDAKVDDVVARFKNGVLTVTIGRDLSQASSRRQIKIEKAE